MKQVEIPTYELLKNKEKKSIEILYLRYGRKLNTYAVKTWKIDEESATDLVYQTLFKTIESIGKYNFASEEKFASFVFTLFMNFLKNHHRDKEKRKEFLDVSYRDDLGNMGIAEQSELNEEKVPDVKMQLLQQELENFEDWERMLLLLRAQDMPYSEIAKYVDKPEEQLKVYHQRLKLKLTERLNERIMKNTKQNV
jgi:RNA polymerase sigma factor (sigma-70 family)